MSFTKDLLDRQINGRAVYKRPYLQDLRCEDSRLGGTILTNAGAGRASPVFYLEYAKVYNKYLASADEAGFICVTDTAAPLPAALEESAASPRCRAQWLAHRNAVFDLAWAKDDYIMYTASGDQTLALWDTSYARKLSTFKGHSGSVKAVSVSDTCHDVIASGGRDGMLMLWDARSQSRLAGSDMCLTPMLCIKDAHKRTHGTPRKSRALCGQQRPSITAVQFLPAAAGHVVATGGVDGCVKMWDLRITTQPVTVTDPADYLKGWPKTVAPCDENPAWGSMSYITGSSPPALGLRDHGVTSLALHPDSCQLLVSLTGGHLVVYDALRPAAGPTRWFGGHTIASFYIKAAFSPDGSHVASGSSDGNTYIWQVDGADGTQPYVLEGHEGEVTSPAFCPSDPGQVATAADDCTIKIWNLERRQEEERGEGARQRQRRRAGLRRMHNDALNEHAEREQAGLTGGQTHSVVGRDDARDGDGASLHEGDDAENRTPLPFAHLPASSGPLHPATVLGTSTHVGQPGGQVALHTATSTGARRMTVSNALKGGLTRSSRRTKQQTLAQAMRAAGNGAGKEKSAAKRAKHAGGAGVDENAGGNRRHSI